MKSFSKKSMKTKKCIDCGTLISNTSTRCKSCANKGKNNPNWQEGLDKQKYAIGFNRNIRARIRYRDKFTCQMCGKKQKRGDRYKLDVHHIDYNKDNLDTHNLVGLCHPCHLKTNYDRESWKSFFYKLFKKRGLING